MKIFVPASHAAWGVVCCFLLAIFCIVILTPKPNYAIQKWAKIPDTLKKNKFTLKKQYNE
jgi:hypothetical protein